MVKQSLQQSLQQKLSPQQIQLMKLIELSTLELEQKVKDELEVNPALDNDNDQSDLSENDIISEDIESSRENQDIDIDQYFKGSGVNGALYGALIGNSLSDFLGAIVDFPLMLALNITFGCLLVIPIVWFILLFKKN